ncbi:protein spaetzle 4 [Anoplophora glabripennis]|uniref:protein spaetzle 4 n=1 Tax=Anoplophora glabripennis TaxID=217634 RepID=UPI0008750CD9|nr:protein spaetzle 4 [Anoplophora glabripennis]
MLQAYIYKSTGQSFNSGGDHAACGRPYRSGRMYLPPCDMRKQGFCNTPGNTYPWHAVKRFVRDNQGLMRRMYGDQRHGHVLKSEFHDEGFWNSANEPSLSSKYYEYHEQDTDNDLVQENNLDLDENEARLFPENVANEDVLNTKFVFSEEPILSIKLSNLKTVHSFRHTTQKTPKSTLTENEINTLTETTDIGTTSETTIQQTISAGNNLTNVDSSTKTYMKPEENTFNENGEKKETILFQDMEEKKRPINFNLKGVNACPVKEEVVAPFWANNTRGETLALLNMYPFEQYVHWEKCTFELRKMYCREGCRCEQQYRLHRLLAYDPNNECKGIFSDWFRFPSCCICKCYDLTVDFRVTSRSPRIQTYD